MKNKLFLLIYVIPLFLFAQQKQPKVGLVLSGGGAKGFAHIAVLKEIDKAGIHLDYIGGTSMGAIIGGMYAAGYSALQIEKIILDTDFQMLIRDKLPRSSEINMIIGCGIRDDAGVYGPRFRVPFKEVYKMI